MLLFLFVVGFVNVAFVSLFIVCLSVCLGAHATCNTAEVDPKIPVEERLTETIGSPSLREFALLSIERGLGFMVVALLLLLVFLVGPFPNDGD